MLHQDIKLPSPLRLKIEVRLHLRWEQPIRKVVILNIPRYFNVIMGVSLKGEVTKLLKKHDVDIPRPTTKYRHNHMAFVDAFDKELEKLLLKLMDAQELQNSKQYRQIG